jgi:hypothetical protein
VICCVAYAHYLVGIKHKPSIAFHTFFVFHNLCPYWIGIRIESSTSMYKVSALSFVTSPKTSFHKVNINFKVFNFYYLLLIGMLIIFVG